MTVLNSAVITYLLPLGDRRDWYRTTTTARSTGDERIVAASDFETRLLTEMMDVTNLREED